MASKKKLFLCIEFHDADGNTVNQLCKCPASSKDVDSCISFLKPGCDFVVSLQECELLENGDIVTPFETIKSE